MSSIIPVKLKIKTRQKYSPCFHVWKAKLHTGHYFVRIHEEFTQKPIEVSVQDTEMDLTEDFIMIMPSGVEVPMWYDETENVYYVASDGIRK